MSRLTAIEAAVKPPFIAKPAFSAADMCRAEMDEEARRKLAGALARDVRGMLPAQGDVMVVGLGKQKGAESVHSDGMGLIAKNLPANAKVILSKAPILLAIPCMENAYDETCRIEAIHRDDILQREPELLKFAFSQMPKLSKVFGRL